MTTRSAERTLNHQSFHGNKKNLKQRSATRYYQSIGDRRKPTEKFQSIGQNSASYLRNEHVYRDSQNVLDKSSISKSLKDSCNGVKINIKDVKVKLKTLEMKYKNEMRERANAELRQKELEIENQKLKDELLLLKSGVMVSLLFIHFLFVYNITIHITIYYTVQLITP